MYNKSTKLTSGYSLLVIPLGQVEEVCRYQAAYKLKSVNNTVTIRAFDHLIKEVEMEKSNAKQVPVKNQQPDRRTVPQRPLKQEDEMDRLMGMFKTL